MTKWILIYIFLLSPIYAQTILNFNHPIEISVNDSSYTLDLGFLDSLTMLHNQNSFYYHIAGAHRDENRIYTILRIPQTLTFKEVLIQILLYYNFLPDDLSRRSEQVNIYPFFDEIEDPAPVICQYKDKGLFKISVSHWFVSPIPPTPSPEDRALYNKLIKLTNENLYSMDEIDKSIFIEVSSNVRMSPEKLQNIYKRVLLWQRSPK